jgi:hypothetical protein
LRRGSGLSLDQTVSSVITGPASNPPFAAANSGSAGVPPIDIDNPDFFPGTLTPAPRAVSVISRAPR